MTIEEIELFRCYLCQKFKPMTKEEHRLVKFKDLIMPKDVCADCFEKAKKEGMIGGGHDPIPKETTK